MMLIYDVLMLPRRNAYSFFWK